MNTLQTDVTECLIGTDPEGSSPGFTSEECTEPEGGSYRLKSVPSSPKVLVHKIVYSTFDLLENTGSEPFSVSY